METESYTNSYFEKEKQELNEISKQVYNEHVKKYPVFITKDSGERQEFSTGSVRDTQEGKGRFALIPKGPLRRLAQLYERGAKKYGDRNWEKGQPLSRYLDSAYRHLISLEEGDIVEDHGASLAWNAFAFMWTAEQIEQGKLPKELDDVGFTKNKEHYLVMEPRQGQSGSL